MDRELINRVMRRESYQYQVLLELEYAGKLPFGWIGTTVFLFLVAAGAAIGGCWLYNLPGWSILVAVGLLTVWLIWILAWIRTGLPRREAELRELIRTSGLVGKLGEGTKWIGEIYLHVHWFWALTGLGWRPRRFKEWIRLLAWNLDWYLAPPRPLFRPEWGLRLLQFTLPVLAIFSQILIPMMHVTGISHHIILGGVLFVLLIFLVLIMLGLPGLFRRRAAAAVLHKIMLEHFDA